MNKDILNEFEDDVEKELLNCSKCDDELLVLEHSVFEDSYYLYCDCCQLRVEVSYYDERYREIYESLKMKYSDFDDREDSLKILMSEIEENLSECRCRGRFKRNSPKRCLKCGHIPVSYTHLTLPTTSRV